MKQIQFDIIKVLELIYMKENNSKIYPYMNTVYNILIGNEKSSNASHYKESPYYQLHKKINFPRFKKDMMELVPDYLKTIPKKNKTKFQLTQKAKDYIIEVDQEFNKRFQNNPKTDHLFNNLENMKFFSDIYFEDTFVKQKDVNQIHNNQIGSIYLSSINKEVEFESGDERQFLEYINENKIAKNIKAQSLLLEYPSGNRIKHYFPDFIIHTREGHIIICEIKAITNMSYHLNIKKYEALKAYCLERGYGYSMVGLKDTFYSFEQLRDRPFSKKLENHVLFMMKKDKCYTHDVYYWYKKKNPNLHPLDIHSLILNYPYKKIKMFDTIELRLK